MGLQDPTISLSPLTAPGGSACPGPWSQSQQLLHGSHIGGTQTLGRGERAGGVQASLRSADGQKQASASERLPGGGVAGQAQKQRERGWSLAAGNFEAWGQKWRCGLSRLVSAAVTVLGWWGQWAGGPKLSWHYGWRGASVAAGGGLGN